MTATDRKRLSREESRRLTRQRLLEAAAEVIPRSGYQATSVEEIAREAGFSRGAFYSNFDSKDDLFSVLLQQICDAQYTALDEIFAEGGSAGTIRDKLRALYTRVHRERRQFVLTTEAKVHAVRDATFRKRLQKLELDTRDRMTQFVARYQQEYGGRDGHQGAEDIAIGLMALNEGISFSRMINPELVSDELANSVLTTFFDSVLGDHA